MRMPALDDTIIAVSTGWQPSPLGILRLSGPGAFAFIEQTTRSFPAANERPKSGWIETQVAVTDAVWFPSTVYWFTGPGSYTGQDLIEIHTIGAPPALRELSSRLIGLGARRALPGEFTARAYLNGKLDADQVDDVLTLINAQDGEAARRASRGVRAAETQAYEQIAERIADLLARVEAGIDFVEEEGVSFITPRELLDAANDLISRLKALGGARGDSDRSSMPHAALAGAPNAGKSTLFNALLGYERAMVSPVLGTTRDVLSAVIEVDGAGVVLQDCAGFGAARGDLEAASHLAAEQAADQADVVLWVHDVAAPWSAEELEACEAVPRSRRILVLSKTDRTSGNEPSSSAIDFDEIVSVSALNRTGIQELRAIVRRRLEADGVAEQGGSFARETKQTVAALSRIVGILMPDMEDLFMPEVVALELRQAHETMERMNRMPISEEVLDNIYSRFCIGK